MSTNTEKPASRPPSATAAVSPLHLDTNGDKSSVTDDNQQNASAVHTLASTFLPDGSSVEPEKANSSRQPSATNKPQSRVSSAVTKSNATNAATSGSRPASAKPSVDDSTTTTVEKTSSSRVSSATKTNADTTTPVDDESHGYSINIGALPSSATPNSDAPANSRPPSASGDAKQGGSRPASAAGQSKPTGSRPSSAANPKANGSRPSSAANGKPAGSQPPSASVVSDQENQHSNPTEPVIGHPTAKKESNENNHANASNILTESNPSHTTSDDATTTAKSPRPGSASKQ